MQSLSVILPTLNCRHMLAAHLDSMRPWLHLAGEIIVVDSHSNDGTLEFLQQELAGLPAVFHSQPRGLYQCWNYGIQQARYPWVNISTIGDSLGVDLLRHLLALGEAAQADMVLSRSECVFDRGHEGSPPRWAIHEILERAAPLDDVLLTPAAAQFYAVWHARTSALTSSAAGNIYRTSHLQQHPFPTEYGTAGDTAWGVLHASHSRIACTAHAGSIFRLHAKTYSLADYHIENLYDRLHNLGLASCTQDLAPSSDPFDTASLVAQRDRVANLYATLKTRRKSSAAWILNPSIWRLRAEHKRTQQLFRSALENVHARIRSSHSTPLSVPAVARH